MAAEYFLIRNLTNTKDDYLIKVRASRIWTGANTSSTELIETFVVFIDKEVRQIIIPLVKNIFNTYISTHAEISYLPTNFKLHLFSFL